MQRKHTRARYVKLKKMNNRPIIQISVLFAFIVFTLGCKTSSNLSGKTTQLDNDSIQPTLKYSKLKVLPLESLIAKNQIRVKNNSAFDAVKSLNKLIIANYFELGSRCNLQECFC